MQCGEDVGWEMGFQSLQKINTLLENQETRCLMFSLMLEWNGHFVLTVLAQHLREGQVLYMENLYSSAVIF